jgi:aryl-alcohol dehydrogenase-like predicted oxidoreductase
MSRLALGCYPLGGGYGAVPDDQARATVDAALDCGWTFLDTAEVYLASEERLGRILEGRRDRVFLATKAYPCESYSHDHLAAALEGSLRRLRTDRVDLYQLHGPEDWVAPYGPTPLEEVAEASASATFRPTRSRRWQRGPRSSRPRTCAA